MQLFTAVYSGAPLLISPSPPSFRRVQVCVHSTEEMCWLVYKGSDKKKWIRKFWFHFILHPSPHMAVNATHQHPDPPIAAGKGDEKLLLHCCCHLPAA